MVAKKHQVAQSHVFLLKQDVAVRGMEIHGEEVVPASSLSNYERIFDHLHLDHDCEITTVSVAHVNGYSLRENVTVFMEWNDEFPVFGCVQQVLLVNCKIHLVIQPWKTRWFSRHYHAYGVEKNARDELKVKTPSELRDNKPVHVVNSYDPDDANHYVAVRFQLS